MPTITFTLAEFLELVVRRTGEYYPFNGYGIYDITCSSCFRIQAVPAVVGETKLVTCMYCGNHHPVWFRSDCYHDGGGVRPVGTRYSILTP